MKYSFGSMCLMRIILDCVEAKNPEGAYALSSALRTLRYKLNSVFSKVWKDLGPFNTDFKWDFKKDSVFDYTFKELIENVNIDKLEKILKEQDGISKEAQEKRERDRIRNNKMKLTLPKRCPVCGAELMGGNTEMTMSYLTRDKVYYYAPIHFYQCGAKIWLKSIHIETGQMILVLNPCQDNNKKLK